MSTPLSSRLVRSKVNVRSRFGSTALLDVATNSTIESVRGNATAFEFGFFDHKGVVYDLTEVESLTLKIQPAQLPGGSTLAEQTLAAADLDLTMTAEEWTADASQHARFEFSNEEMNFAIGAVTQKSVWLVITAILTDGKEVTLAGGTFLLHEDNNNATDPAPENPGNALTIAQADARFQRGLCILRTANEGPPTNPLIRVTGTLAGSGGAVVFPDLSARANLNGKEYYTDSYGSITYSCRWETSGGARWILVGSDGTTARTWSSTEDVATPDLVETWTPASGTTGTPTIVRHVQLPAVAIGQDLRLGDELPYRWFKAAEINPTIWDEMTRAIIDNRDVGGVERLIVDDSTIQTELVADGV